MLDVEQCWAAVCAHDAGRRTGSSSTRSARPGSIAGRAAPRASRCARTSRSTRPSRGGEAAGFRPCKRCRPTEGSPADRHIAAVGRACALIRERDDPAEPRRAGRRRRGSAAIHFHRVFKQITGATPREWGKAHRLGRFADRLDAGEPVAEAVYAAGFGASSRAYEAAPHGARHDPGGAAVRRHAARRSATRPSRPRSAGRWSRPPSRHLHDRARRRPRARSKPICGGGFRPR